MKCLAQLKRRRLLFPAPSRINLRVLAIERNALWQKLDRVVETAIEEKDIGFPIEHLVIVKRAMQGDRNTSISCASDLLPEILQNLSALKRIESVSDAAASLPEILESLSQDTSGVIGREREIGLWRDSLGLQTEVLHNREDQFEAQLEEYKTTLEETKRKMAISADQIKQGRLQLNVDLEDFKRDRANLTLLMQNIKAKE